MLRNRPLLSQRCSHARVALESLHQPPALPDGRFRYMGTKGSFEKEVTPNPVFRPTFATAGILASLPGAGSSPFACCNQCSVSAAGFPSQLGQSSSSPGFQIIDRGVRRHGPRQPNHLTLWPLPIHRASHIIWKPPPLT